MAAHTGSRDPRMVKTRDRPVIRRVAQITAGGGRHMSWAFTFNQYPILCCSRMAIGTGPDHIRMVDLGVSQVPVIC